MRFMVIKNGSAVNAVLAENADALPGLTLVQSDTANIGDLYADGVFLPPPVDLPKLRLAKNAEINVARLQANRGKFEHGGKVFTCDELSRSDIDGVNGFVSLTQSLPPGWPGGWKAVDNTYLAIADVPAWIAFYAAMVATGNSHFAKAQTLKAQLAAATTPEEIGAIQW